MVGEHPAFGGVAPVHVAGSHHYRGEALDVNWPGRDEPARLDAIYGWLKSMNPVELLWRTKGHYDHLHVAFGSGVPFIPGMGAVAGRLRIPTLGLTGLTGAIGQQAVNLYGAGMQERLNKAAWGGWHGDGGTLVARGPTLMGVGEKGTETVKVTKGRGRGPGGIQVRIDNIEWRREGDVSDAIKREFALLAADLEDLSMESGEEV